ncbi:hypothetical protein [Pantoea stewartii]|uniref:Uncharacterized protein n=1 Tax=Pantoea stewartii subsp. stewartii DC283 TaxID=660596 RepID=H3RBI1_PANSE|nr:hypothetical protein [Pantoea stewartii]ARF49624.1 hypothetical protein DSJ_09910 [Pantoea stewartii subsp. stewartii DC283]EHU01320.1 hypothetical protein CKS_4070 [Pantoea stewartii subsp. stewartii DC283]KAB0559987.1 hypothetical protein F7Q90_00930 [Pantoea stewartii subsp. stewartii]
MKKLSVIKEDSIDESFRIVSSPVFVVTRHGWSKRCLSRSAAINNLAHYMVTKTFHHAGLQTNDPMLDGFNQPVPHSVGPHTQQYLFAHNRTARRIRRILAKKREFKAWVAKHEAIKTQYAEHLANKPY